MKITICTQTKTVTIEDFTVADLEKVRVLLAAINEDISAYKVVSAHYYWNQGTSYYGWKFEDYKPWGSCSIDTPL